VIHIRAVSPPDLTPDVVTLLSRRRGVLNLMVLQDVVRSPVGDAVECDVVNAQANEVLQTLRSLGVARGGSLVVEDVSAAFSHRASEAEAHWPRALRSTPIWEQAEARIRSEGRYPVSWFVLLTIAGLIAAVGILSNSQILIVGAMVVGPEYSAIISMALGINQGDLGPIRAGAAALAVGFLVATVMSLAFGLVVRAFGWESDAYRLGIRPVSDLIDTPNAFAVVVATLAGIVGVVSVVESRTGALIGVFISVTTIPAAADIGVSSAFEEWAEARGSLIQLLLNVAILVAVGAAGLKAQRALWRRVSERTANAAHQLPP
jgi:uncharacterized hydrophobic protein (TIGR00271 family)